jgi:hypothetical protein
VVHRASPDDVEKRKFLTPPGLEFRPSVVQHVASRYTDYAIPAPTQRFPKLIQVVGSGVYHYATRQKLSFNLVKYTALFQAEVYASRACAVGNLNRDYNNRKNYILSDRLQWKHLTITGSTQNWFGTAINPSSNWLNVTESNWYGCRITRVLKVEKLPMNWPIGIRMSPHMTWSSLLHFSSNCQEGWQGLDKQRL